MDVTVVKSKVQWKTLTPSRKLVPLGEFLGLKCAWKIVVANIHKWANFPCFFQKKKSLISISPKNYLLKFYSIKLSYLKNHKKKYRDYIKLLDI